MDIVVKGRNVEVPDHYRQHVAEKLQKAERYDQKIIQVDVELFHERNPRQSDKCQRVEITCKSRGPVIRAEANGSDFYVALDVAAAKLDAQLRRAADRRRVHHGQHAPASTAAAVTTLAKDTGLRKAMVGAEAELAAEEFGESEQDRPWHIVRMKEHPADPMTVDDALFQMELVGHDFFLFLDKESGQPSVVYRRRAYDYGVISLSGPTG